MKITSVEIWNTTCSLKPAWHPVLIRINTDEGISGIGEVGVAYGYGHSGAAGFLKDMAEEFLLGKDAMKTEQLWSEFFRESFWGQAGGPIVYGAMSAVDIALWDIKGKALGQPIYQLLGGKTNDNLRTYASQIQFGWSDKGFIPQSKTEDYVRAAENVIADGYDALKVDLLQVDSVGNMTITSDSNRILQQDALALAEERLAAIRKTVGDNVDIIIELHCGTCVASGIQMAKLAKDYGCMFVEEPVHYINSALQKKVSRTVDIPFAAGERIYTRWGYASYLQDQSLDIIQPDICLVGGITEGKKVCDFASVYDVTVQAHVCGSPVSTAAALQLEAAIPNFQIHELHIVGLQHYNRQICLQDNLPVNGKFKIPDEPGLGVDLNEKFLANQPKIIVK
jgi:L-alanine-DL-glutamate epimerase-like enolase superfamily enzyme